MSLLYRLLGVVALVNQRLSRNRVNFIPLNWAAMAGLGVLLFVCLDKYQDAHLNGQTPRTVSVADVLAHRTSEKSYVAVQGVLVPGEGFDEKKDNTVERTWVPMVDLVGRRAFLVQRRTNDLGGKPQQATVTGMMRPMDEKLAAKVQEDGGNIDGVPIDTGYMLVEGERPGSAALWITGAALSALLLGAFIMTFLQKYVVFQPVARAPGPQPEAADIDTSQGADVRVTGTFLLDKVGAQRFLDVPAGFGTLQTGETIFVSNIDASNRFMGMTTAKRAGTWAMILANGSARVGAQGLLYSGTKVRPALRVSYVEAATQKPAEAVLSFGTPQERAHVLALLERPQPAGAV